MGGHYGGKSVGVGEESRRKQSRRFGYGRPERRFCYLNGNETSFFSFSTDVFLQAIRFLANRFSRWERNPFRRTASYS